MAENIRSEKSKSSVGTIFVKLLLVILKLAVLAVLILGLYLFADGFMELINKMRDILSADQLKELGNQIEIKKSLATGTKLVIGVFTIILMVGSFLLVLLKGVFKTIFK